MPQTSLLLSLLATGAVLNYSPSCTVLPATHIAWFMSCKVPIWACCTDCFTASTHGFTASMDKGPLHPCQKSLLQTFIETPPGGSSCRSRSTARTAAASW
jgi:hypothetical protein